ncbi:replication factor A protein [Trifolium repens]|nr:replication factor A protein [Trifolium repens]
MVRVVRLWFVKDLATNKPPFSMEMVFMDKNGDRIHGTVRRTLIYKFENEIKEGGVYTLSNFGIAANVGEYRTTRHQFKLNFQYATKVKPAEGNSVSPLLYAIPHPSELFATDYDTNYLVDLMGRLHGVGAEKTYERNGVQSKMVVIELDNDGATVQNTLCASKLLFNPEYTIAVDLRKRMMGKDDSTSPAICILQDTSKISLEDDFLKATPITTIEALKDNKMETNLVVCGTVKAILDESDWFYTACLCNKKVYPDERMYFCEKCNKHVVTVFPRYRLKLFKSKYSVVESVDGGLEVSIGNSVEVMKNGDASAENVVQDLLNKFSDEAVSVDKEIIDVDDIADGVGSSSKRDFSFSGSNGGDATPVLKKVKIEKE